MAKRNTTRGNALGFSGTYADTKYSNWVGDGRQDMSRSAGCFPDADGCSTLQHVPNFRSKLQAAAQGLHLRLLRVASTEVDGDIHKHMLSITAKQVHAESHDLVRAHLVLFPVPFPFSSHKQGKL